MPTAEELISLKACRHLGSVLHSPALPPAPTRAHSCPLAPQLPRCLSCDEPHPSSRCCSRSRIQNSRSAPHLTLAANPAPLPSLPASTPSPKGPRPSLSGLMPCPARLSRRPRTLLRPGAGQSRPEPGADRGDHGAGPVHDAGAPHHQHACCTLFPPHTRLLRVFFDPLLQHLTGPVLFGRRDDVLLLLASEARPLSSQQPKQDVLPLHRFDRGASTRNLPSQSETCLVVPIVRHPHLYGRPDAYHVPHADFVARHVGSQIPEALLATGVHKCNHVRISR